jgi:hypothetical protein
VDINPDTEAIVTIGSKEGLAHLMLATLDRGDTVLVPDPSYPIHIYGAVIAGADIRSVPVSPDVDFFAELEKTIRGSYPKPKMMIFGFPSNPTAQCVELDFFERVIALAKKHDILVVHDLAYADIVFDGWKAPSIMQVPGAKDVAVEFFTLSKSYNMAGWRIGFMVGNADLVAALARIKSYHDYGTFTPLQVAAIAALEGDQACVKEIAAQYQRRRDVLYKGLLDAGWAVECPKASMYIWARIPSRTASWVRWSLPPAAGKGQGVRVTRHRLWRPRRRACALCADRERAAHPPGGARHQGHVQGRRADAACRLNGVAADAYLAGWITSTGSDVLGSTTTEVALAGTTTVSTSRITPPPATLPLPCCHSPRCGPGRRPCLRRSARRSGPGHWRRSRCRCPARLRRLSAAALLASRRQVARSCCVLPLLHAARSLLGIAAVVNARGAGRDLGAGGHGGQKRRGAKQHQALAEVECVHGGLLKWVE